MFVAHRTAGRGAGRFGRHRVFSEWGRIRFDNPGEDPRNRRKGSRTENGNVGHLENEGER
eukprot:scaffold718_cov342-Pavlova_lutheri.AAC.6